MMKTMLVMLVIVTGCSGGGGGGQANSGLSAFTGEFGGSATGTLSGNIQGTSPHSYNNNQADLSVQPPTTLPAGVSSLAMTLQRTGTFTPGEMHNADFGLAAVTIGELSANTSYSAGYNGVQGAIGTIDLLLDSVEDDGESIVIHGSLDVSAPNDDTSQTDSVTMHLTF
jgi:hypothetical protein